MPTTDVAHGASEITTGIEVAALRVAWYALAHTLLQEQIAERTGTLRFARRPGRAFHSHRAPFDRRHDRLIGRAPRLACREPRQSCRSKPRSRAEAIRRDPLMQDNAWWSALGSGLTRSGRGSECLEILRQRDAQAFREA